MNNNLKNGLIVGSLAGIVLLGVFTVGVKAATTPTWLSKLSSDSATAIDAAGKSKADSLTTNMQASIQTSVESQINPVVEQKKSDIQSQIQAYFDSKMSTITNSPDYQNEVADLDRIESVLLTNYKAQIDAAFAAEN